jgi:hypothetical protein
MKKPDIREPHHPGLYGVASGPTHNTHVEGTHTLGGPLYLLRRPPRHAHPRTHSVFMPCLPLLVWIAAISAPRIHAFRTHNAENK